MDFTIQKEHISLFDTAFESCGEQSVDCDITLPEYFADIVRILRCELIPGIRSHQINGDRITAECCCLIRVLYICDEGKIHCFEQNMQFAKQLEFKSQNSVETFVGAKTNYVNYRVSGQRRFEVHGAVTIFAKGNQKKKIEVISDASGDGIALKKNKLQACDLISAVEKSFQITETCDAGVLSEQIGNVISACGWGIIDEVKIVSSKLFLKGNLIVHTAYITAESHQIETLENTVAINQIIEAPEITDNCHLDSYLTPVCLEIKPRYDSSGNKNLLDISATLNLSAYGYEERSIDLVQDAYSVKYEASTTKSTVYLACISDEIDDTFLCRGIADLSGNGCKAVYSLMCTDITESFSLTEDSCTIQGVVTVDIIFEDSNNEIQFVQRQIPYEYKKPSGFIDGILSCSPRCCVNASSFIINNENELDIRIEIGVKAFIFNEKEHAIARDLTVNKDKIKNVRVAALTVYFAEKDEQLWNIAERYNTTVEAIMDENKLSDSVINEKCKLLIPKM